MEQNLKRGISMRKLSKEKLDILQCHLEWVHFMGEKGKRADLSGADLSGADLRGADLRGADLRGADLSRAYLGQADLRGADLSGADLSRAGLRGADLRGADLDNSCWPLWCGATDVKIDDRIVAKLLFHLTRLDDSGCSSEVREAMSHIRSMAIADLFCE